MDRMSSGSKGRRRMLLTLAGALMLAVGPLGCGDDDEPEVDTVELQLINETGRADLEVYVAPEGVAERTYELDASGAVYADWTKVDYPLTAGIVVQFIVYEVPSGDEVAAGSCEVSDAVALDYARVSFGPQVICSCGFVGTTGCEPGNQ
jgi:hypothetical protein